MKSNLKIVSVMLIAVLILLVQCKKDETPAQEQKSIIPTKFKVDIPSSISYKSVNKSITVDTLEGNHIYMHLRTFIAVGEGAADVVETIMMAIATHGVNHAMTLSYVSDDDQRTKNLAVVENVTYEGTAYMFKLTIADALSVSEPDAGNALQVFWNNDPVKGVAIIKPYNCDRTHNTLWPDAIFRIDYSEAAELGYQTHMIVSIAGLPLESPLVNPYSMSTLKMFVGKNGDVIDVYGNSNHPNAKFFTNDTGFNFAFVAAGNETSNIGVAEVGLPPSTLSQTDRNILLKTHSIKNVFTAQIYAAWPTIDSVSVSSYLHNTEAPGFFNAYGFVQGGTAPSAAYAPLVTNLNNLTPYNPYEVTNLAIPFSN